MLKNSRRISGGLLAVLTLTSCGTGGGEGGTDVTEPSVTFDQITREVFADQNLADFNVQLVPDVDTAVPTGSVTFDGTLSAIYETDVEGNSLNQEIAIGDAIVSFTFDTGEVSGSADGFVLYSTDSGCVEIPTCGLTPVSELDGTILISDGISAGNAFVADLRQLNGTGGFVVPSDSNIGGGFGHLEGDDTLLIWGQSNFVATADGGEEGTIRVLLGGAEID